MFGTKSAMLDLGEKKLKESKEKIHRCQDIKGVESPLKSMNSHSTILNIQCDCVLLFPQDG